VKEEITLKMFNDPIDRGEQLFAEMGQIPSNIDHQEGQHRADPGAPPAWACPAR
jgi:hypothetical protein